MTKVFRISQYSKISKYKIIKNYIKKFYKWVLVNM